mmetsp:Transcript_8925/g.12355  ORF Transcript_8925/g.12355 Transcript_8925/m.12355 type:complete len:185 (-) Transcript_8925:183-737(-)|eukprot:CAMPEP_0185736604 /NCGR_PEP_ID=MMETSP1171-20130828/28327_1 /TAXON_ID=374046 /ORGANISM="Helicotheca tamensis, Strain CCMP826" /LENGTH=184 /DNA_ID=CAMNT_0028407277 /DNA_START=44 /DNA_END=598 /DNA_ORIENTATION=+
MDEPVFVVRKKSLFIAAAVLVTLALALTLSLVLNNSSKVVKMEDEVPLTTSANSTPPFTFDPGLPSQNEENRDLGILPCPPVLEHAVTRYDRIGVWRTGHSNVCGNCPSHWQTCFERIATADGEMQDYLRDNNYGTYICSTYHINTYSNYLCDSVTSSCLFGCNAHAYCSGGCEFVQKCDPWCL